MSSRNVGAFRRQLAPFIEHARKAGRGLGPGESPGRQASRQRGSDTGAWAKDRASQSLTAAASRRAWWSSIRRPGDADLKTGAVTQRVQAGGAVVAQSAE